MDRQSAYLLTIKELHPDLEVSSARLHTSDGQFNDILFVNDDLIFRFPRYKESLQTFLQEVELLQKLQGHTNLPIPNPMYIGVSVNVIGKVFMGYKMLPGKPLFREVLNSITNESTLETFAQQLADFLQALHRLSPASLGVELRLKDEFAEQRIFLSDIQEHLFKFMRPDARNSVTSHFERYFDDKNLTTYQPCIIHGDFGGSNILFDGDKITGIIDFSFAELSDPARDLAALSTFGNAFLARFCKYYPNAEALLERARFHRGTFALYEALHGFRNNDKEAFESGMEQYI